MNKYLEKVAAWTDKKVLAVAGTGLAGLVAYHGHKYLEKKKSDQGYKDFIEKSEKGAIPKGSTVDIRTWKVSDKSGDK